MRHAGYIAAFARLCECDVLNAALVTLIVWTFTDTLEPGGLTALARNKWLMTLDETRAEKIFMIIENLCSAETAGKYEEEYSRVLGQSKRSYGVNLTLIISNEFIVRMLMSMKRIGDHFVKSFLYDNTAIAGLIKVHGGVSPMCSIDIVLGLTQLVTVYVLPQRAGPLTFYFHRRNMATRGRTGAMSRGYDTQDQRIHAGDDGCRR